ncbi:hypothetical protein MGG_06177, partial [Pyricularia oryzae 70-15]
MSSVTLVPKTPSVPQQNYTPPTLLHKKGINLVFSPNKKKTVDPLAHTIVLLKKKNTSSNMAPAQSEAFQKAIVDSKKLLKKPSNEELLELYGLFKVGTGEDITKAEAPGMFDLKGKSKKNAWQKIVDEGVTPEQAQEKYVALVEKLKTAYGFDEAKVPEAVGA